MLQEIQSLKEYVRDILSEHEKKIDKHEEHAETFRKEIERKIEGVSLKFDGYKNDFVQKEVYAKDRELYEKDCKQNEEFKTSVKSWVKRALQILLGLILTGIISLLITSGNPLGK